MPPEKIDSLADDVKPLVLGLLRQISGLTARVDELLAQNKALLARIAELEVLRGNPPKTPDNSSLPPSRSQKGNVAEPTRVKKDRKGRPGAARALAENPDATRDIYAERCACGAGLEEAGQELARAWDHVDLPPIKPITTRINLFRGGAISNMLARMGKPFGVAAEQIAATVRGSEVIASDETSARVKGKTHWQWTFGCAPAVYHMIARRAASACRRTFSPARGRRCGCRIACRRSAHMPRRTSSASRI